MSRRSPQTISSIESLKLPLEPISVRIPVAVQLTGIGRSKLYELIAGGQLETVKIGASRLILVSSLKKLIRRSTEA
ncbi:helix-turn-helix domain-containing protein [Parasphingorhabdus cellanae]|uniref:Helix-turn-helix domain-containing protein n=1 Tax=Parasphingorhabdus cellanae TaxID=2806553 RepID=A0ABX7T8Q1_9SPHN|nr:helix-turn-helix domain-containing protein [Parasphingorhabdus cellanae]